MLCLARDSPNAVRLILEVQKALQTDRTRLKFVSPSVSYSTFYFLRLAAVIYKNTGIYI